MDREESRLREVSSSMIKLHSSNRSSGLDASEMSELATVVKMGTKTSSKEIKKMIMVVLSLITEMTTSKQITNRIN